MPQPEPTENARPVTPTVKLRSLPSYEKRRPNFFWVLAALILPLWSCMVRYRFTPDSKLPNTGPFILAPNHYSEVDPLVMGAGVWHLGRLPRFMAKASLFKVPVLSWFLRASGQIPVERQGSARGASIGPIGAAGELLRREAGVIVYPEGTLTRDPDLWPMRGKTGAVRIALEQDVPLIPAASWGVQRIMPRYGRLSVFPRKDVDVLVGEPVDLSPWRGMALTPVVLAEATEAVMAAITALLAQLRGETPPPGRWDPADHGQTEIGRLDGQ